MVEFNYIRNRIRKYSKESLIMNSIAILRNSERTSVTNIPLWDILLIIKWSFIYAEQYWQPRTATVHDIQFLINKINELRKQHDFYIGNHQIELNKVLSLIMYQQAYLQFTVWEETFSRQIKLFSSKNVGYNIDNDFTRLSGLTINQFIRLSFLLWIYTSPDTLASRGKSYNGIIKEDFFQLSKMLESNDITIRYLNLLSIDYLNAEQFIYHNFPVQNPLLQTFEMSVFTKVPILLFKNNRIIFHKKLLNYTINFFIYDYLKERNNEKFTTEFGKVFEKYIELGLKEISVNYKTERQLKKILPNSSKLVDFLIEDDIMIECKAIELKPYPSVFPDNEVIYNWLKDSIVKAYSQQMMCVANKIYNTPLI